MAATVSGNVPKNVTVNGSTVVRIDFENVEKYVVITSTVDLTVYGSGTDGAAASGDGYPIAAGVHYPWHVAGSIYVIGSGAGTASFRSSPGMVSLQAPGSAGSGGLTGWRDQNATQALSISAGLVAWNVANGRKATLTVSADCTISNPTNAVAGDEIELIITQNGTGGYWVDFGSAFDKPAVWSGANLVTPHRWTYDGSVWRLLSRRTLSRRIGSDTSDSIGTGVQVAGSLQVPPPASETVYQYLFACTSAITSTGVQTGIHPGASNTGSAAQQGRGGGAATGVVNNGELAAGAAVYLLSTSTGSTTVPTPSQARGHIYAHATAPDAFSAYVKTEVGGSNATVLASSMFEITRLA